MGVIEALVDGYKKKLVAQVEAIKLPDGHTLVADVEAGVSEIESLAGPLVAKLTPADELVILEQFNTAIGGKYNEAELQNWVALIGKFTSLEHMILTAAQEVAKAVK